MWQSQPQYVWCQLDPMVLERVTMRDDLWRLIEQQPASEPGQPRIFSLEADVRNRMISASHALAQDARHPLWHVVENTAYLLRADLDGHPIGITSPGAVQRLARALGQVTEAHHEHAYGRLMHVLPADFTPDDDEGLFRWIAWFSVFGAFYQAAAASGYAIVTYRLPMNPSPYLVSYER